MANALAVGAEGCLVIIRPGRKEPADAMGELLLNPAKGGITNPMPDLTGMPAPTTPMGYNAKELPMGVQIGRRIFADPLAYRVASAYEDATRSSRHSNLQRFRALSSREGRVGLHSRACGTGA
ncbi:MAG: hypothetical protein A3F74_00910 [Betaproteobacteria bacterium RIFCSPLOWO2_12_FULL_62_58]|nr:MAG: hypothetical protein A3F74_00910 [Betaproteobacteria bacterium RIFCSPLOWO2_12_FULL_62_58]